MAITVNQRIQEFHLAYEGYKQSHKQAEKSITLLDSKESQQAYRLFKSAGKILLAQSASSLPDKHALVLKIMENVKVVRQREKTRVLGSLSLRIPVESNAFIRDSLAKQELFKQAITEMEPKLEQGLAHFKKALAQDVKDACAKIDQSASEQCAKTKSRRRKAKVTDLASKEKLAIHQQFDMFCKGFNVMRSSMKSFAEEVISIYSRSCQGVIQNTDEREQALKAAAALLVERVEPYFNEQRDLFLTLCPSTKAFIKLICSFTQTYQLDDQDKFILETHNKDVKAAIHEWINMFRYNLGALLSDTFPMIYEYLPTLESDKLVWFQRDVGSHLYLLYWLSLHAK
ncbi:MAG: hypothetical protein K2P51_02040 [Rhabdochlamydiaceae bacterium]|nr:hypothetical protein [Rhabdochlamydiaceae bacterium]